MICVIHFTIAQHNGCFSKIHTRKYRDFLQNIARLFMRTDTDERIISNDMRYSHSRMRYVMAETFCRDMQRILLAILSNFSPSAPIILSLDTPGQTTARKGLTGQADLRLFGFKGSTGYTDPLFHKCASIYEIEASFEPWGHCISEFGESYCIGIMAWQWVYTTDEKEVPEVAPALLNFPKGISTNRAPRSCLIHKELISCYLSNATQGKTIGFGRIPIFNKYGRVGKFMEAIRIQKVVEKDGEILMEALPCKKGQHVELILLIDPLDTSGQFHTAAGRLCRSGLIGTALICTYWPGGRFLIFFIHLPTIAWRPAKRLMEYPR